MSVRLLAVVFIDCVNCVRLQESYRPPFIKLSVKVHDASIFFFQV